MNDTTGKAVSSLAIAEKRPQRPGGCVGIFFQLFDWNRRFAKKKLFSKKLLPAARAKHASKKFGDEKMPMAKHHLIADENTGGFPNVKKSGNRNADTMEQKHEMGAPSLVARLMGLESMPSVQRSKPRTASISEICNDREEKFVNNHSGFDKEDLNLEKGITKHESRPQKLQKTALTERRAVGRFGAEALQFKTILSRSKKHHHHPKLASPAKSPRILSGSRRNTSRLIDAATKILEPSLQATNRAKSAITYSNSILHPVKGEVMKENTTDLSLDPSKQFGYCASASKPLKGQSSCKNCGNLLDVVDVRSSVVEQAPVFASSTAHLASGPFQESDRSNARLPIPSSIKPERIVVLKKIPDQHASLASQAKENMQARSEPFRDGKPISGEGKDQWHLASQQCKPQKDVSSPVAFRHSTLTQNQMSIGRDRTPPRAKLNDLQSRRIASPVNAVSGAKDYISLNRSLSGRTRPRMAMKVDNNTKFGTDGKTCYRQDDSLSQPRTPVRKRRTMNVGRQVDNASFLNSTSVNQGNVRCNMSTRKGLPKNQTCVKNAVASLRESDGAHVNKEIDVISFTFNSPMRNKTGMLAEMGEKRRDRSDVICNSTSQPRKLILDEDNGKKAFQKSFPLRGDALAAFLGKKLKELASAEEDELSAGGIPTKRSHAMILQELISALTEEKPVSQYDGAVRINQNDNLTYCNKDPSDHVCSNGHMSKKNVTFQAKAKTEGTSFTVSHDGDHQSPGSVLEASFSNESFSSSLDDSSGHKLHPGSIDYSYDQPESSEADTDLLDSATSLSKGRTGSEAVADLVNYISSIVHAINLAGARLGGSKLTHVKEVILNAELLFGNAALANSDGCRSFLGHFLVDELETLTCATWTKSDIFPGFEDNTKGRNQVTGFLFDSVIEYLDTKYCMHSDSGYKAWTRLPWWMNGEKLMKLVVEEVRRWADLAGRIPDEIIEWEMSHSLGKWTDFEIEGFETGAEIDSDILQILVDEIVVDLKECSLNSSYI